MEPKIRIPLTLFAAILVMGLIYAYIEPVFIVALIGLTLLVPIVIINAYAQPKPRPR